MLGKQKCRILKEIRQRIADENEIPYVTRDCRFQGNCTGTCPRCESELRYLEQQLALRASLGKRITVAALCAGMAFAGAGCGSPQETISTPSPGEDLTGEIAPIETVCPTEDPKIFVETGEVAWPDDPQEDQTEKNDVSPTPVTVVEILDELSGYVPND